MAGPAGVVMSVALGRLASTEYPIVSPQHFGQPSRVYRIKSAWVASVDWPQRPHRSTRRPIGGPGWGQLPGIGHLRRLK